MSKIEVLKRGSAEEPKASVQCAKCKSLLRIPKSETKYQPSPRPDDSFYECRCPVCKDRIIIYLHQFK